jgi:hypothetical protein
LQRRQRQRHILPRGYDQHGLLLNSNHLDEGVLVQVLAYIAVAVIAVWGIAQLPNPTTAR